MVGYLSAWRRESGKCKASGKMQVTPEVLREWAQLPVDSYGKISLDFALFTNDRKTNDRSPDFTGTVKIDDYTSPAAEPQRQTAGFKRVSTAPDYDDTPF